MGNADVGIYRAAFQLTSVTTFATIAFHTVLYPKISNWWVSGQIAEIENSVARAGLIRYCSQYLPALVD